MNEQKKKLLEQATTIANRWLREMDKESDVDQRRPYVMAAFYFAAAYSKMNNLTEDQFLEVAQQIAQDVWDEYGTVTASQIQ